MHLLRNLFTYYPNQKSTGLLNNLTPNQQAIYREFIIRNKSILKLRYDHPVVTEMADQKLIIKVGNFENTLVSRFAPFRINKYIAKLLNPPVHLGISATPTTGELAVLEGSRTSAVKHSENRAHR